MQSEEKERTWGGETEILLQQIGERTGMQYQMTVSRLWNEELGGYRSYGIRLHSGKETAAILDLSPDMDAVRRFVEFCAALEVFPEHLQEVAENFLGMQYGRN